MADPTTVTNPSATSTTPAASTPAPAASASPAVSAAAAPAPVTKPVVTDITPNQAKVHRVVIPAAAVNAFIAQIDPTAPAGKTVRDINVGFDGKGDMSIRITYNP